MTPVPPGGGPITDPGPDMTSGSAYGDVGEYTSLAPGSYAVSVRPADSPPDTPPALSVRVDLAAGSAHTVGLTGLFSDLALTVLTDDLSVPPPGTARVRVIAAAAGIEPLSVVLPDGTTPAEGLRFPEAGRYIAVPAGPATLAGTAGDVSVDLPAGSVVTLVVLDGPGGVPQVRAVVDATGAAAIPSGGVDAGGGPVPVPAPAVLAVVAVAGLLALGRVRALGALPAVVALAVALVPVLPAPTPAARPVTLAAAAAPEPLAPDLPAPVRLLVPAAGVDAALGPVGIDATGGLAAPRDPARAGWFAGGPTPGGNGPAVVAGHVDWAGAPAVFSRLGTLLPGDGIAVERADGSVARFTVTRVERVAKDAFPTAAVYGPTPGPELRLVTCGGEFDRAAGSYLDNVVVFATAV
ncbi:hypothetical protein GCM10010531_31530 [Blastococcus jejuensis]|uniref:DUF4397 domain-containing protein n=1 Tax=Blastococcus jejuensis TaxID=351224 RepID=A0ABP6PDR3_9ACTN